MAFSKDITGKKYGKLTALSYVEKRGQFHRWLFRCDCGKEKVCYKNSVILGNTSSCGCIRDNNIKKVNFSHGMRKTRFYSIWSTMKDRCSNPKNISYKYYGEKGITTVWKSFLYFKNDMYDLYLNHVEKYGEKETTLDRICNNQGYFKSNCRWATHKEQQNNRTNNLIFKNQSLIIN